VTDEDEALKWFKKAAAGSDEKAQLRLAEAYDGGELGLLTDEVETLEW
jgi:TPR repeat protein